MSTADYTVIGMTCHSCVASVAEELAEVPGIEDVQVDLASGRVTVIGDAAENAEAVRGAIEEAGYQLAPTV